MIATTFMIAPSQGTLHPESHAQERPRRQGLVSQNVFIGSFCKTKSPHKSVNLFLILVIMKDKLTDLWGSWQGHGWASPFGAYVDDAGRARPLFTVQK